jgi:hypothetical protein
LVEEIGSTSPLHSYGIDSLAAIEVRNWIWKEMKANIGLFDILSANAIKMLAADIVKTSKFFQIAEK